MEKDEKGRIKLDEYKRHISLPDFMKNYFGFKDGKRSTKRQLKLYDPKTDDIYICYMNNNGQWRYWEPKIGKAGKSIIDLMLDKNPSYTLGHVRRDLDTYIGSANFIDTANSNYTIDPTDRSNQFDKIKSQLQPIKHRQFFYNRGIKDETIDHPYFKNITFNLPHYSKKHDKTFYNVAFTMKNLKGQTSAISIRNEGMSGAYGKRGESICISSNPDKSSKANKIILAETMDDAMAHHQLYNHHYSTDKIRYISTQGTLINNQTSEKTNVKVTPRQLDIINTIFNKVKPDQMVIGTDNDLAGSYYACQILSSLSIPDHYLSSGMIEKNHERDLKTFLDVYKDDQQAKYGQITFTLLNPNDHSHEQIKNEINSQIQNLNNHFKLDFQFAPYEVQYSQQNETLEARVNFPHSKKLWDANFSFIENMRFSKNNVITRDKPLTKDYTDDLNAYNLNHNRYLIENLDGKALPNTYHSFLSYLSDKEIQAITGFKGQIDSYHVKMQDHTHFKLFVNDLTYTLSKNNVDAFLRDNNRTFSLNQNNSLSRSFHNSPKQDKSNTTSITP